MRFSFVVYSTIVSAMMFPKFWAVFLFKCSELNTQFATVEVVRSTLIRFANQDLGTHPAHSSTKGGDKMSLKSSRCLPDLVAVSIGLFCFLGVIPYVIQVEFFV